MTGLIISKSQQQELTQSIPSRNLPNFTMNHETMSLKNTGSSSMPKPDLDDRVSLRSLIREGLRSPDHANTTTKRAAGESNKDAVDNLKLLLPLEISFPKAAAVSPPAKRSKPRRQSGVCVVGLRRESARDRMLMMRSESDRRIQRNTLERRLKARKVIDMIDKVLEE
jgi:hypothetical protein